MKYSLPIAAAMLSLISTFVVFGQTPGSVGRSASGATAFDAARKLAAEGTAESMRAALLKFAHARDFYGQIGNRRLEATSLQQLGEIHNLLGENQKALEFLNQALRIRQQIGSKIGTAKTLSTIGLVYAELGDDQRAFDFYDRALRIWRILREKPNQAATLNAIGLLHFYLGNNQKALEFLNTALPLRRNVGDRTGEAITLRNIGSVYNNLGKRQESLIYLNQALTIFKTIGNKFGEAVTLAGIGKVYSDFGDKLTALIFFNQALPIHRIAGDSEKEAVTLGWLRETWSSLGNMRLAIFYGKQSVNKYQQLRQAIQGLEKQTQKIFLSSVADAYRKLADILVAEGRLFEAQQVLGMLKEEEYFEFVRRDVAEIGRLAQRVPLNEKEKGMIDQYSKLAGNIAVIGREFIKLDDRKRALSRIDLTLPEKEQHRYDELEAELDAANGAFKLFLSKELVVELGKEKVAEIELDRNLQDKLRKWGEGTVVIYTIAGKDRYRVILTTSTVQIDGKTDINVVDLNNKVFAFRVALQNPKIDPRPLGKELYDILIKPIEKELKAANAKTLVWSLDGTLRYIPLSALSPDGKKYLIEDFQNAIITPKTRDDVSDSNSKWQVLGFGVSDAQTVLSPEDKNRKVTFVSLPGAERELLAIVKDDGLNDEAGILPGRRFMNKDFTRKAIKDSLAVETEDGRKKYNLIHIASHFSLGSNWSNSFLLLGNGEILTLEDIDKSSTLSFGNIELITLSACNTGFADDSDGKEIDSLASVIQTKSGKAVLATLWAVADESTSLLISEFYRLRKENPQLTKTEALQDAQLSMIKGKLVSKSSSSGCRAEIIDGAQDLFKCNANAPFAHPYYWAPFVLIGNWR